MNFWILLIWRFGGFVVTIFYGFWGGHLGGFNRSKGYKQATVVNKQLLRHIYSHVEVLDGDAAPNQQVSFALLRKSMAKVVWISKDTTHGSRRTSRGFTQHVVISVRSPLHGCVTTYDSPVVAYDQINWD